MADIKELKPSLLYGLSTDKALYNKVVNENMSSKQLNEYLNQNTQFKGDYSNKVMDSLKATETTERVSGKVKAAGEDFWEQFPGIRTSAEQESALPFMQTLEHLKHTEKLSEFDAKRKLEEFRKASFHPFSIAFPISS